MTCIGLPFMYSYAMTNLCKKNLNLFLLTVEHPVDCTTGVA